jgi:hypothetical protein
MVACSSPLSSHTSAWQHVVIGIYCMFYVLTVLILQDHHTLANVYASLAVCVPCSCRNISTTICGVRNLFLMF